MTKGDENKFEKKIMKHLTQLKPYLKKYDLEIATKIQSPKDFTFIPEKNKFCLGGAQLDVVIFKRKEITEPKEFFYLAQLNNNITIPYIVLELKSGKVTSDAIRARDVVARDIRNIFPFTTYIFVGEKTSKKTETILRQAKHFTRFIISKQKFNKNDYKKLNTNIQQSIEQLKTNQFLK
jgi:hypothetical protein